MDTLKDRYSTPLFSLGPDHMFDRSTGRLFCYGKAVPLTARQARLLAILIDAPHQYHTGTSLASKLSRRCGGPVTVHSVEQTVCGLRKKLGENGASHVILQSRYGFGYGIFPAAITLAHHYNFFSSL